MKILKQYLKRQLFLLISLLISFLLITIIPIYLYRLNIEIIFYPLFIIFVIFSFYFTRDFFKFKKEIEMLENFYKYNGIDISKIKNNDPVYKKYEKIILKLQQKNLDLIKNKKIELNLISDYYTMWVHQIKTPISALSFLIENVEDYNKRQKLEIELLKIEQYVDMVLNYLRIDSENNDLVAEKVNVDETIKKVVKKYKNIFIYKKISLDYNIKQLNLISDKKWLEFILEQLISNALKYTQNKGIIKIYNTEKTLIIEDNGIGISKDNIPLIFEKGYTGFNGRKERKSSGLGLYLTKKVTDKLNYELEIFSEVNKGTKIIIKFPKNNIIE